MFALSRSPFAPISLLGALLVLAGCSAEDASPALGGESGPVYAMMTQVYGPDDRTVYISLSDTLDITSTELESAREFAGVANFETVGGRIFVSSGTEPTITEFEIAPNRSWLERRTVSFGDYPLPDNANFYYQFVVDSDTALLPFHGTERVVWNPSAMLIDRSLADTSLVPVEPQLTLEAGGNRNGVRYGGSVMQALYYHDDDFYDYGSTSHVVVYDADTFAEKRVFDIPCPGLSLATRDETGNTYFATWDVPGKSLLGERPPTCVAKVTPDQASVETIDVSAWADGHVVNNFRYIGHGKAVGNVLYHEPFGADSALDLTVSDVDAIYDGGGTWKIWLFDVERGTGAPVEGVEVDIGSGAQFAVLDDRTFVFLPYDEWGRTKGYELDADGKATERFDTVGDVFKWVRVR
jgi:hypothetical protein